jgi:hypothetical protein
LKLEIQSIETKQLFYLLSACIGDRDRRHQSSGRVFVFAAHYCVLCGVEIYDVIWRKYMKEVYLFGRHSSNEALTTSPEQLQTIVQSAS